mmetsp:Transcript_15338/g.25318  ORF Transcript_15338/g.25318 Transcript_15338/m.25318 type:complete len:856 (+) Transcript_15338:123-2690(+)
MTDSYVTENELVRYVEENRDLKLEQNELEFLFLRRRRLSLEKAFREGRMNEESSVENNPDSNVPYKVIVLGNETTSGKLALLHEFSLYQRQKNGARFGSKSQSFQNPDVSEGEILPFEIQRQTVSVADTTRHSNTNTATATATLELWAPLCTQDYASLRPQYYPAVDVFVVVFSITDTSALTEIKNIWDQEIKSFLRTSPQHREGTPVILVGNHAEARTAEGEKDRSAPKRLILSQEAVQLARELGWFKYIEIVSHNITHVCEIFRQAALSVRVARSRNEHRIRSAEYDREFRREDAILRKFLQLPPPSARFLYDTRRFEVQTYPGVVYLVSIDGSEPTENCMRYQEPIQLKRPFPPVINVIAISRCKFRSLNASFPVPEETSPPSGHFDLLGSLLVLNLQPNTALFYSMDGSRPAVQVGRQYASPGIPVDPLLHRAMTIGSRPGTSKSNTESVATDAGRAFPCISVVALQQHKFVSRTVHFALPPVLPTPVIRHRVEDGTYFIEEAQMYPFVEFRYTLDGSTPVCTSRLYTGPVAISSEATFKAVAFPRTVLPSAVADHASQHDSHSADPYGWDGNGYAASSKELDDFAEDTRRPLSRPALLSKSAPASPALHLRASPERRPSSDRNSLPTADPTHKTNPHERRPSSDHNSFQATDPTYRNSSPERHPSSDRTSLPTADATYKTSSSLEQRRPSASSSSQPNRAAQVAASLQQQRWRVPAEDFLHESLAASRKSGRDSSSSQSPLRRPSGSDTRTFDPFPPPKIPVKLQRGIKAPPTREEVARIQAQGSTNIRASTNATLNVSRSMQVNSIYSADVRPAMTHQSLNFNSSPTRQPQQSQLSRLAAQWSVDSPTP